MLKQILIAIDQVLNTVVWVRGDGFGYADETLSARSWRLREQSSAYNNERQRKHLPSHYQFTDNEAL